MKEQKHINTPGGVWYRCKRVDFRNGSVHWELDPKRPYGLLDAYRMTPHRQLIQAKGDTDLKGFIETWGPLSRPFDGWTGTTPITDLRGEQHKLTAYAAFIASVRDPEMQRSALQELLGLTTNDGSFQIKVNFLRIIFAIPGDPNAGCFDEHIAHWLETTTASQIESAVKTILPVCAPVILPSYSLETRGRRHFVRASLEAVSLSNALHWMLWHDIFQEHPFQFCAECRTLFQPEWKHERKYCSDVCAHRKTARESARRKRKENKKRNGTQKAR